MYICVCVCVCLCVCEWLFERECVCVCIIVIYTTYSIKQVRYSRVRIKNENAWQNEEDNLTQADSQSVCSIWAWVNPPSGTDYDNVASVPPSYFLFQGRLRAACKGCACIVCVCVCLCVLCSVFHVLCSVYWCVCVCVCLCVCLCVLRLIGYTWEKNWLRSWLATV